MNVSQALEQANAFFFPEILYCSGYAAMESERLKNEESIQVLREAWFAEAAPSFPFDAVRDLADRNRDLCDQIGIDRCGEAQGRNLSRGMADQDLYKAVAALQHRRASDVMRETHGDKNALASSYAAKPISGTVLGIDIETTSRDPDRGYIVNVGWQLMDLTADACPRDGRAVFCGIPDMYEEKGVPLAKIHKIEWADVAGKTPFRQDGALQKELLGLMQKYPFMAHNASFEDSWFTLHLKGYAEGRKAGKIVPIDTRDICRRLDAYVATALPSSSPASLENWARRRGTLRPDEAERHLGLDDTDLMLRTVQAELNLKGLLR